MTFLEEYKGINERKDLMALAFGEAIIESLEAGSRSDDSAQVLFDDYEGVFRIITGTKHMLMDKGVEPREAELVAAGVTVALTALKKYGELQLLEEAGVPQDPSVE